MFRSPQTIGVTLGIIAGLLQVAYLYMLYVSGIKYYASLPLRLIPIVFSLLIIIAGIMVTKNRLRRIMSFKDAFVGGFLVFFIAHLMWSVFDYQINNYIDPDWGEKLREYHIQQATIDLKNQGKTPEEIEQVTDNFEQAEYSIDARMAVTGFGIRTAFGGVVTFILSFTIAYFAYNKHVKKTPLNQEEKE